MKRKPWNFVRLSKSYLQFPIPDFDYGPCVLAGGAIRDSIQNLPYADLDIFGPDEDSLLVFAERNKLEEKGYKRVFTSKFAHTYVKEGVSQAIQLVFARPMLYPANAEIYRTSIISYDQLLREFPFTINQFLYDGQAIYASGEAVMDTILKILRINNLDKPDIFDTLNRVEKYRKKGYHEIPGTTDRIIQFINELTPQEHEEYSVRPTGFRGGNY